MVLDRFKERRKGTDRTTVVVVFTGTVVALTVSAFAARGPIGRP
ncbi:hypothetical protein [Sinosporangium album]|nr:hypothetical protein [Sinosporangium album]